MSNISIIIIIIIIIIIFIVIIIIIIQLLLLLLLIIILLFLSWVIIISIIIVIIIIRYLQYHNLLRAMLSQISPGGLDFNSYATYALRAVGGEESLPTVMAAAAVQLLQHQHK